MKTENTITTIESTTTTTTESKRRGRVRAVSAKVLTRAMTMYNSGKSPEQIAKQVWCKCSAPTLRHHLSGKGSDGEFQVEMRGRGRMGLSEIQAARVVELYSDGLNLTQIRAHKDLHRSGGKKFSLPTLSNAVKAAGITPRRGRPSLTVAEITPPVVVELAPEVEAEQAAE